MDNANIQDTITELVEREKALRDALSREEVDSEAGNAELRDIEVQLDRCWDLLRQRRARAEFGEDPNAAHERPASEVENYRN